MIKDDQLLVMHRNKFGQEYYTLVGGHVELGEDPEAALLRELAEETTLQVANPQLVFIEEAGDPYGTQLIYLCDYVSGDISLHPDSEEAAIHAIGKNLYTPQWFPIKDLDKVPFKSEALKAKILLAIEHGFPKEPVDV